MNRVSSIQSGDLELKVNAAFERDGAFHRAKSGAIGGRTEQYRIDLPIPVPRR